MDVNENHITWQTVCFTQQIHVKMLFHCLPPSGIEIGGLSEHGTSSQSLCHAPIPVPCPRCCSLCEKQHYTIKAGDNRAMRTLVYLELLHYSHNSTSEIPSMYHKCCKHLSSITYINLQTLGPKSVTW